MDETQAAAAFAALSQETRLRLIRLIAEAGPPGMRAGALQASLGVPGSTLSFHLSALEQAGLVQSTKQGRTVIYAVKLIGLRNLVLSVTETCCVGQPELCADISRLLPDTDTQDAPITPAFNVLFLCTQNSARSIMAEAILKTKGNGKFHAYSAGSEIANEPNKEVIETLKRAGHDVSALRCKSWREFVGPDSPRMDLVITLCDTSTGQICPDFGGRVVSAAWPLPDPANFTGTDLERQVLLIELYNILNRRLETFRSLPFSGLDRRALKRRLDELGGCVSVNA